MHFIKGRVTRQAHVNIPDGTTEEEYARRGFFGRTSHLYRSQPMVGWTSLEGDLAPHALNALELPGQKDDWLAGRVPFLRNDDVTLHMASLSTPMVDFFRNADADELLFVHQGAGRLETDFGPLAYRKGDYLVIPRGTVYRLLPVEHTRMLVVESRDEVELPELGVLGQHALFDHDMINVPEPVPPPSEPGRTQWTVRVQRQGKLSAIHYPFNPHNVVGWKGNLTVWQLNVADIRPVSSERYHLPPTAHITFIMRNVVVCSFLPRPLETGDPAALRVPFFHSNIDFDEVLFYHDGDFFSRAGIKPGMVTFHPQGIHHGPQPQAVAKAHTRERTNEQAVMIDTRNPLNLTDAARHVSDPNYWKSWQG